MCFFDVVTNSKSGGKNRRKVPEVLGSADVSYLLLPLPYYHSLTVITTGMLTINYLLLLTLLLICYRWSMNKVCLFTC
jgi:hypothetical protein